MSLFSHPHSHPPLLLLPGCFHMIRKDPFAWRDERGFHLLTHGRDDWWNTHYSYSADGLNWSSGADVACDPNITMTNGQVAKFTNRERPQIFFNEVGQWLRRCSTSPRFLFALQPTSPHIKLRDFYVQY